MDLSQIQARVATAVEALFVNDSILLDYDVGERTIVAKLAAYLKGVFPSHDVDVEYNRHGLDPKTVELSSECYGGGDHRIFPDVIVHRRSEDRQNLLVIEVKKSTNREPRACDEAKIRALKDQYGYEYGVMIELPAGKGASTRTHAECWV